MDGLFTLILLSTFGLAFIAILSGLAVGLALTYILSQIIKKHLEIKKGMIEKRLEVMHSFKTLESQNQYISKVMEIDIKDLNKRIDKCG